MATAKKTKQEEESKVIDVYTTKDGLEIKIKKVPPMILPKIMAQVEMPDRPMYESAPTITGRTEMLPLTEDNAEQVEHGQERWEYYNEKLLAAQATQNEKVTFACFAYGTEVDIPEDGWDKLQESLGIEVPGKDEPISRKAHYLSTQLEAIDIANLTLAIFNKMNISEKLMEEVQGSFRSAIPAGSNGSDEEQES